MILRNKLEWVNSALEIKSKVSKNELKHLYNLSKEVKAGCIIEIGSYHGRSTVALCKGSLDGHKVPVYAIEPHEEFVGIFGGKFGASDRVEFFKNMISNNCAESVRLVNLSSEIVAPNWQTPISLLWIDGDHSYEAVNRDFKVWEPYFTNDISIAFHDSLDPNAGPYNLINELVNAGSYRVKKVIDLMTIVAKN